MQVPDLTKMEFWFPKTPRALLVIFPVVDFTRYFSFSGFYSLFSLQWYVNLVPALLYVT